MCDEHEVGYRENAKPEPVKQKVKEVEERKVRWFDFFFGASLAGMMSVFTCVMLLTPKIDRNMKPPCKDTITFNITQEKDTKTISFSCADERHKMEPAYMSRDWGLGTFCRCMEKK